MQHLARLRLSSKAKLERDIGGIIKRALDYIVAPNVAGWLLFVRASLQYLVQFEFLPHVASGTSNRSRVYQQLRRRLQRRSMSSSAKLPLSVRAWR